MGLSLQEHGERILRELGLTFSQAKLYLALTRFNDSATANELSSSSNIARQDVYQLLEQLHRISLVEKIVANPTEFRAIPMKEATAILLERRNQKTQALVKESEEFLVDFNKTEPLDRLHDNNHFVLIPKGEAVVHRVERSIKAAQKEILAITPRREFSQWIFTFREVWRQAIERGVRVRWITEKKPQTLELTSDPAFAFLDDPRFNLRVISEKPEKRVGIYDGKEVFIAVTRETNAGESGALWTDNLIVIHTLQDYFELKWQLASEIQN